MGARRPRSRILRAAWPDADERLSRALTRASGPWPGPPAPGGTAFGGAGRLEPLHGPPASDATATLFGPMLDDLTPEQRAAVTHPGGPALVLAGAGAGKTRVLCHRLAWLVEGGVSPPDILALTFTPEAAVELRARAQELIGRSHETLRVATFHSYALELARVHGVERGLLPATTVARTEDRMLMLLERLDELDLREHDLRGDRGRLVADLVDRIDKCRDQL